MSAPKAIQDALTEIVYYGILMIRMEAKGGNSVRCAIEAEHIHNLPNLINNYSDDYLLCYYPKDVQSYLAATKSTNVNCFRPAWMIIDQYLKEKGKIPHEVIIEIDTPTSSTRDAKEE